MKTAILLSIIIATTLVMINHAGSNKPPDVNENSESVSVDTFAGGASGVPNLTLRNPQV